MLTAPLTRQLAHLQLMAFDVDGVLTDGSLFFTPQGDEMKVFSSLDGHGLKMLMDSGVTVAIITGRRSAMVEKRAQELGITHLFQGIKDKRTTMTTLCHNLGIALQNAGYMGDDVVDLPVLSVCGFAATVADGHDFVKQHVNYVSQKSGGHAAVREVCDLILQMQGKLEALHAAYLSA